MNTASQPIYNFNYSPSNSYRLEAIQSSGNNALGLTLTDSPTQTYQKLPVVDHEIDLLAPPSSPSSLTASFYDLTGDFLKLNDNSTHDLVLHPVYSSYTQSYPQYDVFLGTPLIDNGYIATDAAMDTSDDVNSISSFNSDLASITSCTCFDCIESANPRATFYNTQFPVMIEDDTVMNNESITLQNAHINLAPDFVIPAFTTDNVST